MENFPNLVGSAACAATRSEPLFRCFRVLKVDFFAIGKVQYSRQCNSRTKGSAFCRSFITMEAALAPWVRRRTLHESDTFHSRASAYPSSEGGCCLVDRRVAGTLEHLPPRIVY